MNHYEFVAACSLNISVLLFFYVFLASGGALNWLGRKRVLVRCVSSGRGSHNPTHIYRNFWSNFFLRILFPQTPFKSNKTILPVIFLCILGHSCVKTRKKDSSNFTVNIAVSCTCNSTRINFVAQPVHATERRIPKFVRSVDPWAMILPICWCTQAWDVAR